jgi:hypothetical protein
MIRIRAALGVDHRRRNREGGPSLMIDDLAAFYSARLDEAERLALASGDGDERRQWTGSDNGYEGAGEVTDGSGFRVVYDEGAPNTEQALHIALHDPAAVLRDVAAKRAVLAEHLHLETDGIAPAFGCRVCHNDREWGIGCEGWCLTVRHLASEFSTHAGYRPEWAP